MTQHPPFERPLDVEIGNMKIEIEKEYRPYDDSTWYRILVNGSFLEGSFDYEKVKKRFDEIKANPKLLNGPIKEILQSEEI